MRVLQKDTLDIGDVDLCVFKGGQLSFGENQVVNETPEADPAVIVDPPVVWF